MDIFNKAREELTRRADRNGDGRLDRQDVSIVLNAAEEAARIQAARVTQKNPLRALLAAAALGAILAGFIAWHVRPFFGA